jgi:uncharacterized membrane protein YdfJ with MMPL/SSD domain
MAAVLGIHKADLKVVQVFEGSVIIEFQIFAPDDDEDPMATLQFLEQKFKDTAPTLGDSLGAPVMQIVTNDGEIIPMDGYEDLASLANNKNFATLIEQFQQEQAEKAKNGKSIWEGMTEVVDDGDKTSDSSDSGDYDSTASDDDDQKAKVRAKVTKTKLVTEVVTKEESAAEDATQIILIVVVCVLSLIIISMTVLCVLSRKRQHKPVVVEVQKEKDQNVTDQGNSFEDN